MSDVSSKLEPPGGLISRNVFVHGRRTSIRLEPDMWVALFDIARREGVSVHAIASQVDDQRREGSSLTAAIRVYLMAYYRAAATEDGHRRAGHRAKSLANLAA